MNIISINPIKCILSILLLSSSLLNANSLYAANEKLHVVTQWQIIPAESSLTFTAIQNGAPVSGQFKSFTGDVRFDPNKLNESSIRIVIAMNSVFTTYTQVADTLKSSEWFNVKSYPQAIFIGNQFTKTGDNSYQVKGMLTIRNKTNPTTINFIIDNYTKSQGKAHGTTTLQRTAFDVGQGDWATTSVIKDDVEVKFSLSATAK